MKLYIRQKVFSLRDRYTVFDEHENPVFYVEGRLMSLGAKIRLFDTDGAELYYIEQKVFRLLPEYEIYKGGELVAVIKKEFTFFRPKLSVDSALGVFEVDGDFFGMDFSISIDSAPLGSISKAWLSFGDSYEMQIDDATNAPFFVTLVIAIDNCLHNGNE